MSIKDYAKKQWDEKYSKKPFSNIKTIKAEWGKWVKGIKESNPPGNDFYKLTVNNLDMAKPDLPSKPVSISKDKKMSEEQKNEIDKKNNNNKEIYDKKMAIYTYMVEEMWKKTFGYFLAYGSPEIYGNGQFGYNFGYAVSYSYGEIYNEVDAGQYDEVLEKNNNEWIIIKKKESVLESKINRFIKYKKNKDEEEKKQEKKFDVVKHNLTDLFTNNDYCKFEKEAKISTYYNHKILILNSICANDYKALPFIKDIDKQLYYAFQIQDLKDKIDGIIKDIGDKDKKIIKKCFREYIGDKYTDKKFEKFKNAIKEQLSNLRSLSEKLDQIGISNGNNWVCNGEYIIKTLYAWINEGKNESEKIMPSEDNTRKLSAMLWDLKLPDTFGDIDSDKHKQIIYTGAPGTGKTYGITEYVKNTCIMNPLDDDIKKEIEDEIPNFEIKQWEFVQFHSSYDYSDFVEGLRPVQILDGQNPTFVRMDGTFKEFCRNVIRYNEKDPSKIFYFIIDEINRADIGKVFGELMYCLDEDYRGNEKKVNTQYKNLPTYVKNKNPEEGEGKYIPIENNKDDYKDGFYIPENLHIIGSMNDIDRSVETFDFALRRRFQWKEIKALGTNENDLEKLLISMFDKEENSDAEKYVQLKELVKRIKEMNKVVSGESGDSVNGRDFQLNESYQIGAAYFKKFNGQFNGKSDANGDSLEVIWKEKIEPTLREYVRGNDKNLVDDFIKNCRNKLLLESDNSKPQVEEP